MTYTRQEIYRTIAWFLAHEQLLSPAEEVANFIQAYSQNQLVLPNCSTDTHYPDENETIVNITDVKFEALLCELVLAKKIKVISDAILYRTYRPIYVYYMCIKYVLDNPDTPLTDFLQRIERNHVIRTGIKIAFANLGKLPYPLDAQERQNFWYNIYYKYWVQAYLDTFK